MGALDGFEIRDGRLDYRGKLPAEVAIQWSVFDNRSGFRQPLPAERKWELPRAGDGIDYVVAELSGSAGPSIEVYVKLNGSPKVVGIERRFDPKRIACSRSSAPQTEE